MKSSFDADAEHRRNILDQFSRQAGGFAAMPAHSNEDAFEFLYQMAGFRADDSVLDVCCGPGLVACAVAPKVGQVTGIDLTPAMIDKAKRLQEEKGLSNVAWEIGDVEVLPFADNTFSCVLSRYAFHHILHTQAVFDEMCRVTRPGGRVIVIDVTPESSKREAYDRVERLRDSSHTQGMTLEELTQLGKSRGLGAPSSKTYGLEVDLRELLTHSFPDANGREELYQRFEADLGKNELGFSARRKGESISILFPTTIAVWRK